MSPVLALAIETVALVFVTALAGLACGFCVGALAGLFTGREEVTGEASSEEYTAPEELMVEDPQPVRRIPDPAPPSQLRRRRLLVDQPKPDASS